MPLEKVREQLEERKVVAKRVVAKGVVAKRVMSHPVYERNQMHSHMCARISLLTYDRQ